MVLCMMTITMGIFWIIFGYQIYRKKKFFLINRYIDKKITGQGALAVGKSEMIYGMIAIPMGVAMFFMPEPLVWILFFVLHLGFLAVYILHINKYKTEERTGGECHDAADQRRMP